MSDKVTTRALCAADLPLVSDLHARVFGPGRFARTAYRVRERRSHGTSPVTPFCRAAFLGPRMIASLNMTAITIGGAQGAMLLGPVAVDPSFAGQGYGRRLIAESLAAARAAGVKLVVLVGDESYYGRFGFTRVPSGAIALPGPVDPMRILAVELVDGAARSFRGIVAPA